MTWGKGETGRRIGGGEVEREGERWEGWEGGSEVEREGEWGGWKRGGEGGRERGAGEGGRSRLSATSPLQVTVTYTPAVKSSRLLDAAPKSPSLEIKPSPAAHSSLSLVLVASPL